MKNVKYVWHTHGAEDNIVSSARVAGDYYDFKLGQNDSGDAIITYIARVSNPNNQNNTETASKLIRYMIRNKHWSPFDMANLCVEIDTTRDISRQILRHQSIKFQEFSQRYSSVDVLDLVENRECRLQDDKNRQNSRETDNLDLIRWFDNAQTYLLEQSKALYDKALDKGIAKECARVLLLEGLTPTRMYANGTLRSWIHFIESRTHDSAQKEVRDIAHQVSDIMKTFFPITWEAAFGEGE